MEFNLFNAGVRPAINVGISVSRVGGSAQIKPMKKVAGTLKLDQAQFRELEAFAKFGSDLDAATKMTIDRGRRNVEILKQKQYSPVEVEKQVAIIFVSTKGYIDAVPVERVKEFEEEFIMLMDKSHRSTLDQIKAGKYTDEVQATLKKVALDLAKQFSK